MKPTRQRHAPGGPAVPMPAWDTAAELGRQQIAVATESMDAMLRGFNAICRIQEQAMHQASSRHAAAAEKLSRPCEPAELLQLQSQLMRFDVEEAVKYWQQVAAATLEAQTEMMCCTSHLLDSETLLESASAVASMQSALGQLGHFSPAANLLH